MQAIMGSKVMLKCKVTDGQQGNLIDDGNKPMTFVLGKGQVIAGLEEIIKGREIGCWIPACAGMTEYLE